MSESVPITDHLWRKSSHSQDNDCVEIGLDLGRGQGLGQFDVLVRDSAHRDSPVLRMSPADWRTLVARVRT